MIRLDWMLFGNGFGMKSPFFDDTFFWLNDLNFPRNRKGRHGNFYRWSGGFGAQLHSIEWRMPKPGTRRYLFGHEFVVFSARRKFIRVECSWALATSKSITEETLSGLKKELMNWY